MLQRALPKLKGVQPQRATSLRHVSAALRKVWQWGEARSPAQYRHFSMLEVTPAASSFGLPEASAMPYTSASTPSREVSEFDEVLRALQGHRGRDDLRPHEVQSLVDKSLELARGMSLKRLADLADCFRELRLRVPLRDMMPIVSDSLLRNEHQKEPEVLESTIRIMSNMGKGSVFFGELFQFCDANLNSLNASLLATYLYEAGRHGLRCRHFIDAAVSQATAKVPEMTINEVMMVVRGFIRFSRDWISFFSAARNTIAAHLSQLDAAQLLLTYRLGRDLRHLPDFAALHAACAAELSKRVDTLSLNDTANILMHSTFSPKFRAQAHSLVRAIAQRWSASEDLSCLRIVEAVDALECFASWGMRPLPLMDRLDSILVERTIELKYAGNVGLWVSAIQAFARVEHFGAQWPRRALELSRDKAFCERVSFYQQCAVVGALSKLRLFDETVFNNIAELLMSDRVLFKEPRDLAPVLYAYTIVGHKQQDFFDGAYDLVLEWLEREELDLSNPPTQQALIQIIWCFAAAGYHQRYESFSALLDYAFFTKIATQRPLHVRRLAQLADVVLCEAAARAEGCQYTDRISSARTDPISRRIISSEPSSDPKLFQEVRDMLTSLNWSYEVFATPDDSSGFLLDISLRNQLAKNVGIMIAGQYDVISVGLPSEQLPHGLSGNFALAKRILAARGWHIAVISAPDWAKATTNEQKKALLEKCVSEAAR